MDQRSGKEIYDRVQILILESPAPLLFLAETIDFTQASVKGFKQHPTTCCTASTVSGSTGLRRLAQERRPGHEPYLAVRLYSMGLTLVGLTVLVFLMLRLVPGRWSSR